MATALRDAVDSMTDTSATLGQKPEPARSDSTQSVPELFDRMFRLILAAAGMAVTPSRLLERAQGRARAVREIESYGGLPADWDHQGAQLVSRETTERAVGTLRRLARLAMTDRRDLPAPIVGPTPGGSIHLQWNLDDSYVAVECPPPGVPLSYYADIDGREVESDAASLDEVWSAVRAAFV